MSEPQTVIINGYIHLCYTCHQPLVMVNGNVTAPGTVTVWKDRDGATRITPHAEGCEGPVVDPLIAALSGF